VTEGFLPLVIACAALTVLTRAGGYLLLSRVRTIPPRLNVALEAVPAAVLTTLFAPAILSGTWREAAAMALAALLAIRFGPTATVFASAAVLAALRTWS
jgi:uncharacterized membrane protein